jgi:hypothetical protein
MQINTNQPAAQNGSTQPKLTDEQLKDVKEQRNRFIELQSQSSQAMDKLVVLLAGGALTVSLAFLQPAANQHPANPATMPFLAIAWIFLPLSLFAQLISHFSSQYCMMKTCERIEHEYLGMPNKQWTPKHSIGRGIKKIFSGLSKCFAYRMTTHYLNIAAVILCIAGISMLTWFVFLNFPQLPIPHMK